jgi:uncharacterized protein YaaQ
MSKLLIAIVHHDDAAAVADDLRADGRRFTQVPTVGGFLGEANATFVLAVEEHEVEEVLGDIEGACHARDVEVPLVLLERLRDWDARTVAHGGATVLIADLERIVRL